MSAVHQRIADSFARQGLMTHLGAKLLRAEMGEVAFELPMSERVTQQLGAFHGGAVSALADIACGYAALTRAPEGMEVSSVEFKINFISAARGSKIEATGKVLKAGRTLAICQAEVMDCRDGKPILCAAMQATMIYVAKVY